MSHRVSPPPSHANRMDAVADAIADAFERGFAKGQAAKVDDDPRVKRLIRQTKALLRFAEDAPRCDYNEDRVLSWLTYVTHTTRDVLAAFKGDE